MTVSAETLRLLVEAGLSGQQLLAVVESIERDAAEQVAAEKPERSKGAERTRRWREKRANADCDAEASRGDVTVTRHERHTPPLSLPPSPQTPQPPTHTPPDVSTRTREAPRREAFDVADGFAVWWLEYPNKVAKAAAQKAYAVACRKIGGPDPPAILLAGLRRAKSSDQWLRGFIPHPTTWLNQGRWEDEPSNAPQIDTRPTHDAPRFDPRHAARQENHARAFAGFEAAARGRSERG